jgi:hypothetical protein
MEKAVQLDKNWRMMKGILDLPRKTSKGADGRKYFNFKSTSYRAHDAMDVDADDAAYRMRAENTPKGRSEAEGKRGRLAGVRVGFPGPNKGGEGIRNELSGRKLRNLDWRRLYLI